MAEFRVVVVGGRLRGNVKMFLTSPILKFSNFAVINFLAKAISDRAQTHLYCVARLQIYIEIWN